MSTPHVNNRYGSPSELRSKLKHDQNLTNPCLKEHKTSLNCLERNRYDYEKCELAFENYRICKKFWGNVMTARRRQGIRPILPPPEEREKVKAEYLKSQNT